MTFPFSSGSADTGIFNKMQNDNEREYKLMKFNREKTDLNTSAELVTRKQHMSENVYLS